MFLLKIVKKLDQHKISYAIAGGYALALHGIVRATMDVDLILNLRKTDFVQFQKAMQELSLQSRLPLLPEQIIEFREEYIEKRNLIAWSFVNFQDPSEIVDVLLIEDLAKLKTVNLRLGQHKIKVISLSDLLRMKKINQIKKKTKTQKFDSRQALKNLQFLEDMRVLNSKVSSKSKLISMKVPENLLRAFQFECEQQNLKYQTQIKKLMWEWLEK